LDNYFCNQTDRKPAKFKMADNKVNNKFMLSVILAGYEIIKKSA